MNERLVVTLEYELPPRAEDIGALFIALARDYKKVTRGRVLVVATIENGSIIATLTDWALQAAPYIKDAVEIAKGGKALADFAKVLKDGVQGAKSPKPQTKAPRRARKSLPAQPRVRRLPNALLAQQANHIVGSE